MARLPSPEMSSQQLIAQITQDLNGISLSEASSPPSNIDVASHLFAENRLESFASWIFDRNKTAKCTSEKLALSGFISTATIDSPSSAECVFCGKEMEFEEEDDPWEEHVSHCPKCIFVKINKIDERSWTVEDYLRLSGHLDIRRQKGELDQMIADMEEVSAELEDELQTLILYESSDSDTE